MIKQLKITRIVILLLLVTLATFQLFVWLPRTFYYSSIEKAIQHHERNYYLLMAPPIEEYSETQELGRIALDRNNTLYLFTGSITDHENDKVLAFSQLKQKGNKYKCKIVLTCSFNNILDTDPPFPNHLLDFQGMSYLVYSYKGQVPAQLQGEIIIETFYLGEIDVHVAVTARKAIE